MTSTSLPLLSQLVLHDAFNEAYETVETILRTKDPRSGCIIPILGPTRVGKSGIVKRLIEKAGQANTLFPQKNVVRASLPPQTNGKDIYESILRALHKGRVSNAKTDVCRDRLYRAIETLKIEVIILDEVNHLIERGANLTSRVAADHLKTLVDETGVNLVLSGLPRFQRILDENEQLRDRASATVLFQPYDWQDAANREAFCVAVDAALGSLEAAGFAVDLEFEDIVRRLYGASGGRVPMVLRILKLLVLIDETPRSLGLADFLRAARALQQSGVPAAAFFGDTEPDEVELMRSFAAVMSEAGLQFNVESLAALGVVWDTRVA